MEVFYLSSKHITLYDATELMEDLRQFRPPIVQSLLKNCNSIKVKRFFLYFVERFWSKWLPKLDLKKINLGQGKRVIGRGERYKYNAKHRLSLPEKIDEESLE